ncbi:isoc2 [Scenedesmus sp. PABB004]|nr:isoc2 [Scenedesmus sp. PABB004]
MAAAAATAAKGLGKLQQRSTALFVCDLQERFRPVISGFPAVVDTARRMIRGANVLGLPIITTEQYPKALGSTVQELKDVMQPGSPLLAKTRFSMVTPEVSQLLKQKPSISQVLLCGIETHVCVLQTTLDLLEGGYEVHILVDGVSSQRLPDRAVGLQRAAQSGAFLVTSEMALFQLMEDAKAEHFKEISKLVQEPRMDSLGLPSAL